MKSALNGGLNLSVLDGWWAEAYNGTNGWAIPGDILFDHGMQDSRDAAMLFDIIEHEVVPLFYQRDEQGIPRGWVQRMRASLRTNGPRFSAQRMMLDYARDVYNVTTSR
jgi:starch phosphorylase